MKFSFYLEPDEGVHPVSLIPKEASLKTGDLESMELAAISVYQLRI